MISRFFIRQKVPFSIFDVDLGRASNRQLVEVSNELGIGLNVEEMKSVKEYF
jgi:hypothetical protein